MILPSKPLILVCLYVSVPQTFILGQKLSFFFKTKKKVNKFQKNRCIVQYDFYIGEYDVFVVQKKFQLSEITYCTQTQLFLA